MTTQSQLPESTSLYVGKGVLVEGRIQQDSKHEVIVIDGTVAGDISSEGRVILSETGSIEPGACISAFELDIHGRIDGPDVKLEAGILRLSKTARVSVSEVVLPVGGLEQVRGSVLSASVRMTDDNRFAGDDRLERAAATPSLAPLTPAPIAALQVAVSTPNRSLSAVQSTAQSAPATKDAGLEVPRFLTTPAASTDSNPSSAFDESDDIIRSQPSTGTA